MISPTNELPLSAHFDCVVMLTRSNWHTEPRSNRYHYATRFAKHLPVIFVQPDLSEASFQYEETDIDNLSILHIFSTYGAAQNDNLNQALLERRFIKPLLWTYNFLFSEFVVRRYAPLKIYHATEDYFNPDFIGIDQGMLSDLKKVLSHVDLLVAVSEGVKDSYINKANYSGETIVLNNGCDFNFWAINSDEVSKQISENNKQQKIAFYQGGINFRLNYSLIESLIKEMPDWELWFCGEVSNLSDEWESLCKHKNLKYFGKLHPEQVRQLAHQATVGIIPLVENDLIIKRSFPLKAFEYVACGLPVVTVPIESLLSFPEVFHFASSSQEFISKLRDVAPSRYNVQDRDNRLQIANEQDYDKRFEQLQVKINSLITSKQLNQFSFLKILILYDKTTTHINTVKEYLESFCLFSQHHIFYAPATLTAVCSLDLSLFDVVALHYSVRLSLDCHISPSYAEAIKKFSGFKVLFIQDEYDTTETTRNWIEKLGIHLVFTCVPNDYRELVYPSSRFPYVEFVQILTGFVPIRLEQNTKVKPISERNIVIGYRGRPLAYYYGNLAQEKSMIGKKMREICEMRGINVDIEWEEEKRIYGDNWYEFVESCKATLGTESGSNVFDDYGHIRQSIDKALAQNPSLTYEEIHEKYLAEHEGKVVMNQISPKIFEAISLRTALVLFEGKYSGIVQPNIHYIPLKKDFSNVEEVLNKLNDNDYLQAMTSRAYKDIIESGKYSYKRFILEFDRLISLRVGRANNISPISIHEILFLTSETLPQSQLAVQSQLESQEAHIAQLQATIDAMKTSKFWKLRTLWFKFKKLLGLGKDVG
jgi:glycosyltransferase involved in cell wall biosynthesis